MVVDHDSMAEEQMQRFRRKAWSVCVLSQILRPPYPLWQNDRTSRPVVGRVAIEAPNVRLMHIYTRNPLTNCRMKSMIIASGRIGRSARRSVLSSSVRTRRHEALKGSAIVLHSEPQGPSHFGGSRSHGHAYRRSTLLVSMERAWMRAASRS